MKPGRNDPCPCGSGKKYKKCCLPLASTQTSTQASVLRNANITAELIPIPKTTPVIQDSDLRFFSPVTSFYTQAALMEALRPGGTVRIHPYVLIKMRDDPRFSPTVAPADRQAFEQMWKPSMLAAMTTDEIERQLASLGIQFTHEAFIHRANTHRSAWELSMEWRPELTGYRKPEREFLGLAACELWRRLCPERPSVEMLDDWLCEGYGLSARKQPAAALTAWLRVWQAIRQQLDPSVSDLQEAGRRYFNQMSQCLTNWSQDFRLEAMNGSLHDPACADLAISFITTLREALPAEAQDSTYLGDLAMIYFNVGRDVEGEECCQKLMLEDPRSAIGYVTLSDGLIGPGRGTPDPEKVQRAISVLEKALAVPVQDAENFDLSSRLEECKKLAADIARR